VKSSLQRIARGGTRKLKIFGLTCEGGCKQAAQNDDDWQPIHFEFAFGLEPREGRDPASTATEAVLSGRRRLRVLSTWWSATVLRTLCASPIIKTGKGS